MDTVFASHVLFTVLLKAIVGIAGTAGSVVKVTVDGFDVPALLYALIL